MGHPIELSELTQANNVLANLTERQKRLLLIAQECEKLTHVCKEIIKNDDQVIGSDEEAVLHKHLGRLDFALYLIEECGDIDVTQSGKHFHQCLERFEKLQNSKKLNTH